MDDDTRIIVCRHCGRYIENDPEEGWIDRAAGYDDEDGDGVWRYTCDAHATFVADHEPFPQTEDEKLVCIHGLDVWVGNECGMCEHTGLYKWADPDATPDPEEPTVTLTKDNLVLHTDAPLDLLCFVVAEHGLVAAGTAVGHGGPDCVYGWAEPWDPEKDCKPHHLVYDLEPSMVTVLAQMIVDRGRYQIVVTDRADWSVKQNGFPECYDWAHQH
jgi:hypothetical protein